jgi:hypothetical protein
MCDANSFADTGDTYIGLRYFAAADTLYGWVKVSHVSVDHPNINQVACTIEALASESGTTGTSEWTNNRFSVRLSPNPASGIVRLDFARALQSDATLELSDHTGRVVLRQIIGQQSAAVSIDVSTLSQGVYFYTCRTAAGNMFGGKLVVSR